MTSDRDTGGDEMTDETLLTDTPVVIWTAATTIYIERATKEQLRGLFDSIPSGMGADDFPEHVDGYVESVDGMAVEVWGQYAEGSHDE